MSIEQTSTNFPKILDPHPNSGCQKNNMEQVPQWGGINIRHHRTKFSGSGHSVAGICTPLVWNIGVHTVKGQKIQCSERNLFHCRCVDHKSHIVLESILPFACQTRACFVFSENYVVFEVIFRSVFYHFSAIKQGCYFILQLSFVTLRWACLAAG